MCHCFFLPKWGDVTNPEDINEDSHDGMDDHTAIAMFVSVWGAPRFAVLMSYDMPWGFGVPFCETAPCYIM